MKTKDVPQDLKYYRGTVIRDLNYAVDEDGCYKAVISDGWEAKTDALDAAWDEVHELCDAILNRVKAGETSLLEYYATKNLMTIELLSSYTGLSKRKIRKHFNPRIFSELDDSTLDLYAEVLRITKEELTRMPE